MGGENRGVGRILGGLSEDTDVVECVLSVGQAPGIYTPDLGRRGDDEAVATTSTLCK